MLLFLIFTFVLFQQQNTLCKKNYSFLDIPYLLYLAKFFLWYCNAEKAVTENKKIWKQPYGMKLFPLYMMFRESFLRL